MGFNIGNFISSIAGPVLGFALGGPIGAAVATGVSAGFDSPSPPGRATTPPPAPAVKVSSSVPIIPTAGQFTVQPAAFRGAPSSFVNGIHSPVQQAAVPAIVGRALTGAGVIGGVMSLFGNGDNVSEILKAARSNVRGATKNKIITAAKACGIELAAQTFGLSTSQVCQVIVAGRSRRRRGVSAADVRRTKRTIRFVNSLRKELKKVAK